MFGSKSPKKLGKREQRELDIRNEGVAEGRTIGARLVHSNMRRELEDLRYNLGLFIGRSQRLFMQRVQSTIEQGLETRLRDALGAGQERLSTVIAVLKAKQPLKLIEAAAAQHRQNVIRRLGADVENLLVAALTKRTQDLLTLSESKSGGGMLQSTGIMALPTGTRYVSRAPNGATYYIIEQAPTMRTVKFAWDGERRSYRLAFPFVIFLVQINPRGQLNQVNVFFRKERLTSMNDSLLKAALPNTYNEEYVCFYGTVGTTGDESITQKIEIAIEHFWGSTFNHDGSNSLKVSLRDIPEFTSLAGWERESLKDPAFGLKAGWLNSNKANLLQAVDEFIRRDDERGADHADTIRQGIFNAAQKAGVDAMEIIAQKIERWTLEGTTGEVISKELSAIFAEGSNEIRAILDGVRSGVFTGYPSETVLVNEANASLTDIVERTDHQLRRIDVDALSQQHLAEGAAAP